MSLQVVQFQYGLEFLRLSLFLICGIEFLKIVISKANGEQVGIVLDRIMAPSDPEVIVDQVSNLSAAKETVLFLGLLFLQTDSPFELGIMEDFVQCRSNPRIKYFKIRH